MSLLQKLWGDIEKLFKLAPVIAPIVVAADPNAAAGVAAVEAGITALQPTVDAVNKAAGGNQTHEQLVAGMADALAQSSVSLTKLGVMDATTNEHIQAVAPLFEAAVAVSGLASNAAVNTPTPPAKQ